MFTGTRTCTDVFTNISSYVSEDEQIHKTSITTLKRLPTDLSHNNAINLTVLHTLLTLKNQNIIFNFDK